MALERALRLFGGLVALVGLLLIVPGVRASARAEGRTLGRPEFVLSAGRLAAVSVGWFGVAVLLWRPLPLSLGGTARLVAVVVGTAAYLGGMGLAVAGRLALGESYRVSSTLGLRLAPDHRLVSTGPYGWLRHPMYAGLALAAVGAILLYRTWTTLFFVAQVPALVARARIEDRALREAFGGQWEDYARRVPAWVPQFRRPRQRPG